MNQDQFLPSFEGTWARLSQVAVKGAEHDSRERQPHPKCLEGTRVDLLSHIHGVLDNRESNQLIWLHGTAGVGKSAVAFTVAERMRNLKVTEKTNVEKRLTGTFFFSRKHTERCTTGYFFATLVYQLASNFPSIRQDVNRTIRDNPALLDSNKSLRDQMEALFLQPLRKLYLRLRGCQPLMFVVDALDECTSKPELVDLILLLARALRQPDLPVTHILFTSRLESHICKAMQNDEVRSLVHEIPVQTCGEGVARIISLDGADVDHDIYVFLQHSFREMESHHPDFPRPSRVQLERLASRAGRRFIVASTMMKFIDDGDNYPHDRLQLMLELTSELLPGTEVYKLYDCILSTCADPKRAYLHLSIVAALANPLPISQISKLLGPGLGNDVETTLMQLRSVMDIPADSSLPVNLHHSTIRDYVSNPSNCSLREVQDMPSPHSLLALSSFRLMMKEIPETTALLDALSELKRQSQAMKPEDPHRLKDSLAFLIQPPEPLSVLTCMLWLRGDHSSEIRPWLETLDGFAWLQTQGGEDWLQARSGRDWLHTKGGEDWLQTQSGKGWLQTQCIRDWPNRSGQDQLQIQRVLDWLQAQGHDSLLNRYRRDSLETEHGGDSLDTEHGRDSLETQDGPDSLNIQHGRDPMEAQGGPDSLETQDGPDSLETQDGPYSLLLDHRQSSLQTGVMRDLQQHVDRLRTQEGYDWLQTKGGRDWLQSKLGRAWLQSQGGRDWLQAKGGQDWLQAKAKGGRDWLQTKGGRDWLQTKGGEDWLQISGGRAWLQTKGGRDWLQTKNGRDWLQTKGGRDWLWNTGGRDWLQTQGGRDWLRNPSGRAWLQTQGGRDWLRNPGGQDWLQTPCGQNWLQTQGGKDWLKTNGGQDWLQTQGARNWLKTQCGRDWLQIKDGRDWLQIQGGQDWLQTKDGRDWLQIQGGRDWLQTPGAQDWLQTPDAQDWLQTPDAQDWLQTTGARAWLQTPRWRDWLQRRDGKDWLQTRGGQDWLQTMRGQDWLEIDGARDWLKTEGGRDWLQTQGGRKWLQTQGAQDWLQTACGQDWLQTMCGQDWLQAMCGQDWLQTPHGQDWLQKQGGQDWLQKQGGRTWLQTQGGRTWLQTLCGRDWLQTLRGRDWLQTPHGQAWQSTPAASVWLTLEDFSSTLEVISEYIFVPELPSLPAFQVILQFKSLPDFLMFSTFLALRHQNHFASEGLIPPDREIIHAMNVFITFANDAQKRSRSASDSLKYACHNWAIHLSRAPNPWDDTLKHIFQAFWDHRLLSWLERQWCLKDLPSCLIILSEGQKLAEVR